MSTQQPSVPLPTSSAPLWATPSKEWVIPAKPKPGRKPKNDAPPPAPAGPESDAKGRRVQNRAAQRAFRERKQSQLADLQARVQQYEQGEIERNVALQNIAKRLKEENEKLRLENTLLKENLAKVEEDRRALQAQSKKRSREDSSFMSPPPLDHPSKRRTRALSVESMTPWSPLSSMPMSYMSSPSTASSPDSTHSHTSFSPIPVLPPPRESLMFPQSGALSSIFDFIATGAGRSNIFEPGTSLDAFDCGFCSDNTPCVCRELAMQQAADRLSNPSNSSFKVGTAERDSATSTNVPASFTPPHVPSILDNLPAYQPPVPLRRKTAPIPANSIFPVTPAPIDERPSCSGDPSNCMVCADDPFGKAFCAAINKSVASSSGCDNRPGRCEGGACRRTTSRSTSIPEPTASRDDPPARPTTSQTSNQPNSFTNSETIPCDDAWRRIKDHPNVAFADLELLAEVVARRSKCTGPRVEILPAPGSITPERDISPSLLPSRAPLRSVVESNPVLLTDPHANYHDRRTDFGAGNSSSSRFGSGRRPVRLVTADGVRDALRLLDSQFSVS